MNVNDLLMIIGSKEVELALLKSKAHQLEEKLAEAMLALKKKETEGEPATDG